MEPAIYGRCGIRFGNISFSRILDSARSGAKRSKTCHIPVWYLVGKLIGRDQSSDKLATTRFCFVAFRFPRKVVLYQIHESAAPQAMGELALDCEPSTDNADDLRASEIHSIDSLEANGVFYLLLGMRHGMLISCRVEKTDTVSFSDIQITKFGNSQVGFISAMHSTSDKSHLFLTSDYLWEVRLKNGQIENDEILFDDFRTVKSQWQAC